MKSNKVRVAITNKGNVLVVHRSSELYPLLGNSEFVVKTIFSDLPGTLENFFSFHEKLGTFSFDGDVSGDVKKLFDKFFSYYITCKVYNLKIDHNKYGLLKRALSEFGNKLWSKIQRISAKMAKKIINIIF